jgi:hypothetical protein
MKRPITTRRSSLSPNFVICINNDEYPASLEKQKVYRVIPDAQAKTHKLIRVVDESGEDYLYPVDYFLPVRLSQRVIDALAAAT